MTNPSNHALVLDIGGSHVTAALVDLEKRQVDQASLVRRSVAQEAAAEILIGQWAGAALDAMTQTSTPSVTHVGIAMPGPFEYVTGISRLTHKFASLNGWNVGKALSQRWEGTHLADTPVRFANDAALWALGEWWAGAARGTQRMIGVTLGTGLGSGFIDQGNIVNSGDQVPPSGEIWWVPYLNGITEDQVSGRALVRGYQALKGDELTPAQIANLASTGDPHAQSVFAGFGDHLAAVLQPWVQRFNPNCLVVGGNIARAWALFRVSLEAGLPGLSCRVTEAYEISGLLGGAALRE
jgi:glucokinase